MILHGLDAHIKKGDTLKDPKFIEEDNDLAIKRFDMVMSNFPFSLENWWKNGEPKKDKKGKPITKKDGSPQLKYPDKAEFNDPYDRFPYGTPPFSNGDFAFVQHIIASIDKCGKAGIVCPQAVLFRGQPEKTEEEDGQNRKADDEYLIRRGFLQGAANKDGEFLYCNNIIDAIVVLPRNIFYGTSIQGAIVFFDKNKPTERKNKVLMVYAAKDGWYKEEPNMNVLLPQDILRVSTLLESWGNIEIAKEWMTTQKKRLRDLIQEELDFKKGEILLESNEDIYLAKEKLKKINELIKAREANGNRPTKAQLNNLQKAEETLEKLINHQEQRISEAEELAENEKVAIDQVETELLNMYVDPDLRKRYFAIVDIEELEENEFNLNIPRYVDTYEPEEEIDLNEAVKEFEIALKSESEVDKLLSKLLGAFTK